MDRQNTLEDWKRGNLSTTKPLDRIELMNIWLKKNKAEILSVIKPQVEEDKPLGFEDLRMYD